MKINTYKQFTLDAVKSIRRNITISVASIATVAATLFILGIFLLLMSNVNKLMSNVESGIEIKVFLKDGIATTDQTDIENALKNDSNVQNVTYQTKDQALSQFKDTLGDDQDITQGYDSQNNPLPAAFIVKLKEPQGSQKVINMIKEFNGVDSIGNDQDFINTIVSISKAVRWVGVGVFILLMGVSIFLIGNTIRLTVFSRRREIGIMKFVGATDWFIRWPFIIEGVIIGIIGGVIGDLILFLIYKVAYKKTIQAFISLQLVHPQYVTSMMLVEFMAIGALIGALGSINALRKFLTV